MTTKKRIVDRHKTMDQASPLGRFREPREVLAVSSRRGLLAIEDHQFADRDIQESRNLDEGSGGDTIGPVLVFLHLLKRNAEMFA